MPLRLTLVVPEVEHAASRGRIVVVRGAPARHELDDLGLGDASPAGERVGGEHPREQQGCTATPMPAFLAIDAWTIALSPSRSGSPDESDAPIFEGGAQGALRGCTRTAQGVLGGS